MRAKEIEERFQAFYGAEDLPDQAVQLPAGWELASKWQQLSRLMPNARTRRRAEEAAITAVLDRARELLRHASRPRTRVAATWPSDGEIDVERTLEHVPVTPETVAVERRDPLEVPTVAMLDMSLSMTGEKIALVAVAAAILRLALGRLAVVAFDTDAHRLVGLRDDVGARVLVRRVLTFPAQGYTNIEAGLRRGLRELEVAPAARRTGVLLSDGVPNIGFDPAPIARRFRKLHVVQLGKPTVVGTRTCRDIARAGHGDVWLAEEWEQLPRTVRELVRAVFRR